MSFDAMTNDQITHDTITITYYLIKLRINLQNIILIQSDGCDLDWNSVNGSVVIAGVGGNTILKIVNSCPIKLRSKLTWILNPFTSVEKFDIEISKALPVFNSKKVEVIESGRIRWIYKFSPQS